MTAVPSLSRFEFDLVRIARALVGELPLDQVKTAIIETKKQPACLSASCVRLVESTLRKGLILFLVRAGGWQNQRFLRHDKPTGGRVWERIPLEERTLAFSGNALQFLIWITAEKPFAAQTTWKLPEPLTPGDELFFALALEALQGERGTYEVLRSQLGFTNNPLAWVMNTNHFATKDAVPPPSFRALFSGVRAAIMECLQPWLVEYWTRSERSKRQLADWNVMALMGRVESTMWPALLEEAERAARPDLARFVLRTLSRLLRATEPNVNEWFGSLTTNAPLRLADRLEIRRNALTLIQQMATLAKWDRQARTIGFFDDGYAASQLWKEEYETYDGSTLAAKATKLLAQIEPLHT